MNRVRRTKAGRSVLLWAAASLVGLNLAFALWADAFQPALYDPEYAAHDALLRERRAERPGDRLLVALGSSRVVLNFRPERLPPLADAGGRAVTPFNFAHTSAGPVYSLLSFRRLVRDGHAPDFTLVEVMPLLLREESTAVYTSSVVLGELRWLDSHVQRWKFYSGYAKNHWLPTLRHRRAFMALNLPDWQAPATDWLLDPQLDRLGGERRAVGAEVPPELAVSGIHAARANGPLFPTLRVAPDADSALRKLLSECRSRGVRAALLLAPESPEFRRHYTPVAAAQLIDYVQSLTREYGCGLVDARDWLEEGDFSDGHHVVASGQSAFTDRLGRDFLTGWVRSP